MSLAGGDATIMSSLLDCRRLAGAEEPVRRLQQRLRKALARGRRRHVDRLVEARRDGGLVECPATDQAGLAGALKQLIAGGIEVVEFRREQRRLEEAFVDMVKRQADANEGAFRP